MKKGILICVLIAGVLVSTGCSGSRVKAPKEVFAPEEAFAEIPRTVSGNFLRFPTAALKRSGWREA